MLRPMNQSPVMCGDTTADASSKSYTAATRPNNSIQASVTARWEANKQLFYAALLVAEATPCTVGRSILKSFLDMMHARGVTATRYSCTTPRSLWPQNSRVQLIVCTPTHVIPPYFTGSQHAMA